MELPVEEPRHADRWVALAPPAGSWLDQAMRWSPVLLALVCSLSAPAQAEPETDAVLAAARAWQTPKHVCQAMARASHGPRLDVRRCRRDLRAVRLPWIAAARGDQRYAETTIGGESLYIIRVLVDRRGRVSGVESEYSWGGV